MDIGKSSTAHWQNCNEVPTGTCSCSSDNRCKYSETYSEGRWGFGWFWIVRTFTMGRAVDHTHVKSAADFRTVSHLHVGQALRLHSVF